MHILPVATTFLFLAVIMFGSESAGLGFSDDISPHLGLTHTHPDTHTFHYATCSAATYQRHHHDCFGLGCSNHTLLVMAPCLPKCWITFCAPWLQCWFYCTQKLQREGNNPASLMLVSAITFTASHEIDDIFKLFSVSRCALIPVNQALNFPVSDILTLKPVRV